MTRTMWAAAFLAAGLMAGCETRSATAAACPAAESKLDVVPLAIATAKGERRFCVEVARTAEEQARGLMFRGKLAADRGMLFPTSAPEPRSFWMKDTPQPLDLIFIRADGTIARVTEETTPYSLDPIPSGEPVIAVLEIAGGGATALGIAEGDRASWDRAGAAAR